VKPIVKSDRPTRILEDTASFVTTFREPISHNPPHIYLSALPFLSTDSQISEIFKPQFRRTLHLQTDAVKWTVPVLITKADGRVKTAAFSPNGKPLVSGSDDKTIRIWDAETGEEQAALKGHDGWVSSVAFSPDGKRVVSGSRDDIACIRDEAICANTYLPWKALDAQGWMLGFKDQRLFWVPPQHRRGLCWPDTKVLTVIGSPKTILKIEDFVHGKQWTRCYTGGKMTTPDGHESVATEESAHG
jgi:WD40 repeat protein